jgi:3-hydroxyisobutyrate dehydrogenase-like beta-hydroxyacid dehydrogenase
MKLGFIGLGRMGTAMAANLVRAGHDVVVFNRSPGKGGSLIELGAHEAANLAAACRGDAVVTMLAHDDAASDIVLGPGGVIDNLQKNAIHLSMSTISVALSKRLSQAHAQAGQRYVAAPVFGRPDMAAAAKLFIVAAGDPGALDACQPLFRAIGQKTISIGTDPSAANHPHVYVELLTSTIFNVPAYKTYGTLIAEGRFEPAAFAAPLGYKDIRLALAAAESLGVPMPLGSLLHDRFLRLLAHGGKDLDWSALGALAAQDAGNPRAAARPSLMPSVL